MLGWPYRNGVTATRSRSTIDPRTRDPGPAETATWEHCALLDPATGEQLQTASTSDVVLMGPPDADVKIDDKVVVDGRTWQVNGTPYNLRSFILTGASRATPIRLRATTGGS